MAGDGGGVVVHRHDQALGAKDAAVVALHEHGVGLPAVEHVVELAPGFLALDVAGVEGVDAAPCTTEDPE